MRRCWARALRPLSIVCLVGSCPALAADLRIFFVSVPSVAGASGRIFHRGDLRDEDAACKAQRTDPRVLNIVDQEGGRVRRFASIPGRAAQVSARDGVQGVRAEATHAARLMRRRCVHVNLAPVVDAYDSSIPTLRSRSFSPDPALAFQLADAFSKAMRTNGIVPTWKHFPGHSRLSEAVGEGGSWRHYFFNRRFEALVDHADRSTIERGAASFGSSSPDLVMLSQSIYPALDPRPAVLIPAIAERARALQPRSLLISDDLSELRLSDQEVLAVFRNVDLMLVTSPADLVRIERVLRRHLSAGNLMQDEVRAKRCRLFAWRRAAGLPALVGPDPCSRDSGATWRH